MVILFWLAFRSCPASRKNDMLPLLLERGQLRKACHDKLSGRVIALFNDITSLGILEDYCITSTTYFVIRHLYILSICEAFTVERFMFCW